MCQTMVGPRRIYRVLVADDHPVVRVGVRRLLESQSGIEVCGEASDGRSAIELSARSKPNLVLLDLNMPDMAGLETVRGIKQKSPRTDVVILATHLSKDLVREAVGLGVLGYVLKSDTETDLLAAVQHARLGQRFFASHLAGMMAEGSVEGSDPTKRGWRSQLTAREIEVIRLLATKGHNREVAAALKMSVRTIESHRHRIMRKMKFESFSDLVRFAVREGLVQP